MSQTKEKARDSKQRPYDEYKGTRVTTLEKQTAVAYNKKDGTPGKAMKARFNNDTIQVVVIPMISGACTIILEALTPEGKEPK